LTRDPLRRTIAKAHVEDLVQYNDGFRTQLIGTPEQVARRIVEYRGLGVDLILTGLTETEHPAHVGA
jgi:alkanesulfonate monooxygenase SsuD/methylene tetrahydromethanopterin reductase-like flavin-dependent oxidoreductase (luciferase family)